MIHQRHRWTDR